MTQFLRISSWLQTRECVQEKALYSLSRYKESLELLHILISKVSDSNAEQAELSRAKMRIEVETNR
jgi:hypothetical protein